MPFDGSGNYNLPATTVTPAVADTIIDPAEFNTFTADLKTALSLCLTEDGQNVPTANLPMATFHHTGVGDATALTDYASANQVIDNTLHYGGTSAAGTDTYAVNLPISPGAYVAGNRYQFIADVANTGACTINFSSLGAKSIKMQDGNDPFDSYIAANSVVDVEYDGTNMVLMSPPSNLVGNPVTTNTVQSLSNKTYESPKFTGGQIATLQVSSVGVISKNPSGWTASKGATGTYTLTHNLGLSDTAAQMVFIHDASGSGYYLASTPTVKTANAITYLTRDLVAGASIDVAHNVLFTIGNVGE